MSFNFVFDSKTYKAIKAIKGTFVLKFLLLIMLVVNKVILLCLKSLKNSLFFFAWLELRFET